MSTKPETTEVPQDATPSDPSAVESYEMSQMICAGLLEMVRPTYRGVHLVYVVSMHVSSSCVGLQSRYSWLNSGRRAVERWNH
jgi:hypothetical protein